MKKLLLMKTVLLLCALIAGSSSMWADNAGFSLKSTTTVPLASGNTKTTTIAGSASESWTVVISGTWTSSSMQGSAGSKYWQMGANGAAITSATFSTSGITGTITSIVVNCASYSAKAKVNCTVGGNTFGTQNQSTPSWSNNSGGDVTFSGSASGEIIVTIDNSASGARAAYIQAITVTYSTGSGPVTYSVSYNGNGATSGTAPTDATAYSSGATVTVLGNTGSLAKTGYAFGGWNTKADGKGTNYSAGNTFSITASTTLYAKWNYVVVDGVFDFEKAGATSPLTDYGSGVTLSSDPYTTEAKTWTAVNVTMATSGKYRWWNADKTLRFYDTSYMEFSVPDGYVITKIDHSAGTLSNPSVGSMSGSSWVGASQSVKLQASGNFKSVTVTYTTATQSETVQSYGWATYIPKFNVQFAENTAYVVTDASVANGLTLAPVTQVPAGTPLLLKGAGEKSATVIASASAPATNLLTVCNGTIADGKYAYVLAKNGASACFKKWTGSAATLNGRVVLVLGEAVATSRSIFNLDDETTSIKQVETAKSHIDGFYNLAGQRVAQPTKGLYIVNGRKVIVK